jgi:membrane associated rhomboid family serine protease
MWALYAFGPQLERQVGGAPFAALYVSSALAGGALFYLLGGAGAAVGASGAIFGLFGAWLAASYRGRHTLAGAAGLRQLLVLLAINLALPLVFPAIAWQAHLGGLAAGVAITTLWGSPRLRANTAGRTAVAAAVGVGALVAVIVL